MPLDWTSDLSVKVKKFDDEHKKLIALINNLSEAMKQGKGKEAMTKVIVELINYTKTHFSDEEALMQKHGYTGLEEQKKQHVLFVNKIDDLKKEFEKGGIMTSVSAATFLNDWIKNHIMKIDKKYSEFFNGKGVV